MSVDGVELATAYVTVVPSFRGVESALRRELQQPLDQAASLSGRSASNTIERELAKVRPDFNSVGKSLSAEVERSTAKARATMQKGLDGLSAKSDQRLQVGTSLLAGAGVATLGLKTLADAASDYGEQQSKANVILGKEGTSAAEKFAAQASKTAGLSKTAALAGVSSFAGLGKMAGLQGEGLASFGIELSQLAGDLASFNNTSVDQAIAAIGSGLRGEAEPLRAFNILLDDATLKQEAMSMGIYDGNGALTQQQKVLAAQSSIMRQSSDAQGDFVRTSDGFANQQRKIAAEVANLKTELGAGLLPIASKVTGGLSSLVEGASKLPAPLKEGVSSLAGYATAGAGAVGVLSTIGGAVGKAVDRFTTVSETASGSTRQLNGLGKAATGVGLAFGALAAGEAFAAVANEINGIERNIQRVNDELTILENKGQLGGSAAAEQFSKGYSTQLKKLDVGSFLGDMASAFSDDFLGTSVSFLTGRTQEIDRSGRVLQRTLDSLSSPEQKAAFLDWVETQSKGLDKSSKQFETTSKFVNQNRKDLDLHAKAVESDTKKVDEQANKQKTLSDAYDNVTKSLEEMANKQKLVDLYFEAPAKAAASYLDEIGKSTTLDDRVGAALRLGEANRNLGTTLADLPKTLNVSDIAFGKLSESQAKSVDSLMSLGDATSAYISNLISSSGPAQAVQQADSLRAAYVGQFQQLGLNSEQINSYLELIGLTPDQVTTAIKLSGTEAAKFEIGVLQGLLKPENLAPDTEVKIAVALKKGDYEAVRNILFERVIATQTELNKAPLNVPVKIFGKTILGRDDLNIFGITIPGIPARAMGGPVAATQPYVVGERGPELFVPKAAGTIIPNHDLLRASNGGSSRPAPQINQTITNASYAETLEATVNALRSADAMGH